MLMMDKIDCKVCVVLMKVREYIYKRLSPYHERTMYLDKYNISLSIIHIIISIHPRKLEVKDFESPAWTADKKM